MPDIFLDNNASTLPLPEVVEAVSAAMTTSHGNPSSPHSQGNCARRVLQTAKAQVTELVGGKEEKLLFTSGGTEANNLVIQGICRQAAYPRLITTTIEHSSVLQCARAMEAQGVQVDYLEVDKTGRVAPEHLQLALRRPASLVSIQWANSETGTIQPIAELAQICQNTGTLFHVDAAQAVGRVPIDLSQIPISFLTFTAHKFHGPQGVGAIASNDSATIFPIIFGGDQQGGIRPGTENMPGIAGFGAAAKLRHLALVSNSKHMHQLRTQFEDIVLNNLPEVKVNGDLEHRVVNSSNLLFPDIDGMSMMALLDNEGICCSLTSACSSAKPEPSHVLRAMGFTENEAFSSLRFSFSILNTQVEVEKAAIRICKVYERLLSLELSTNKLA